MAVSTDSVHATVNNLFFVERKQEVVLYRVIKIEAFDWLFESNHVCLLHVHWPIVHVHVLRGNRERGEDKVHLPVNSTWSENPPTSMMRD